MTTEQPDNSPIVKGIKDLKNAEAPSPDELTRQRHISSMNKALKPSGKRRYLISVAAAVALVAGAGLVVAVSSDSSNSRQVATPDSVEIPELKKVDSITAVPFERTEDYVIITADASKAEALKNEIAQTSGTDVAVISKTSARTSFVVPASIAKTLTNTSGVTVVADTPIKSIAEQSPVPSWGLDRIDASDVALNNSYRYFSTGAGSIIYVIDTGVYSGHADLSGRVVSGYTAVNDGNGTEDCNGHGTHVAGTAAGKTYGVAKSATVVAIRVLDCAGSGFSSSVVAGINWAIASHPGGPGVINLSLGGPANSAVDTAVADATRAGLVVVAAAGNSATDACSSSPARAASAITIGATDQSDNRASYSNFGSCVDMYAPGSAITSAWISGSSSTRSLSGTSMASPHVAGLAARLQQAQPGITVSGIAQTLTTSNVGTGTVSIANFVENEEPVVTTTTTLPATTVPETTTTTSTTVAVAPTTTTTTTLAKKRPGGPTTTNPKSPGQKKTVVQAKEFAIRYEMIDKAITLAASWVDNRTPETYSIECVALTAKPDAAPTNTFMVERTATKIVEGGRTRAELLLTPSEPLRCWVVAMIGEDKGARSNPAILIPRPETRKPPVTTVAPTTTSSSTTSTTPPPTTAVSPPTTASRAIAPTTTVKPGKAPTRPVK